ncbi:MAG: TIGR02253 family HAD-type hydrolase [bacterium]
MLSVKALFFDIDDTLYPTSEFAHKARINSIEAMIEMGLKDVTLDQCMDELHEVINEFGSNYDHHYDLLLRRLPQKSFEGINPVLIIAAGVIAYHKTKKHLLAPYKDVSEFLKIISKSNIILGVITAGIPSKQAEKLIRLDLEKYFDPRFIFISDQIGIGKSNPKLYKYTCENVNIDPHFCMNIGNNPLTDIDPANSIGMTTVLVQKGEKYKIKGKTKPTYTISNMRELLKILKKNYDVHL